MRWLSRLVTITLVVALVGGVALLIRSAVPETTYGGGFKTYAVFRDGSKLQAGSPVVIAGVRIGDITAISLSPNNLARVDMRMQDDIVIRTDAFATRRADSLFGDSYIEIIPGPDETAPQLAPGQPITHVQEGSSTDTVLRTMDRALPRIDNAIAQVDDFMKAARAVVNGPFEARIREADQWLSEGHIEAPLTRADQAMETVEAATAGAAEAMSTGPARVRNALDRFGNGVASARTQLGDVKSGLADGLGRVRSGMSDLDPTLRDISEMMTAINEGQGDDWKGTLGRLVNDRQLGEDIDDVTASLAEGVHGFNRFTAFLGARVELGWYSKQFRFYATAEIRARNDKFYYVELERSSLGQVPVDQLAEVSGTDNYIRTQEIRDGVRFTGQFGKQIGPLQLRGGLKDSTFGIGADLLGWDGRLKLSADVFGSFQRTPRLKVAAALAVFRSIYIIAGVDDALNEHGILDVRTGNTAVPTELSEVHYGRDYFIGGALHFTDVDLATLLRVYGALLIGLL